MRGWRILLSRLAAGLRRRDDGDETTDHDPFVRPADLALEPPEGLARALAEIEAGALDVYAAAGLPTAPGHYRRNPNAPDWTFIAARLSPDERFALALTHPAEEGWRFARLQDLGTRSTRADVRAASRLLNEIDEMRMARRGLLNDDHLLLAMELGGAWRALRDARAVKASRLELTAPESEPAALPKKRRARRDKPLKPR